MVSFKRKSLRATYDLVAREGQFSGGARGVRSTAVASSHFVAITGADPISMRHRRGPPRRIRRNDTVCERSATTIDEVVPIVATATVINDLITSVLLFYQFSIVRRRALSVLASGYLFTALIVIPWALTFPGLFAATGLLGAGLQTTVWLYIFWHAGAPLVLIVFVLLKDTDTKAVAPQRSPVAAIGLSVVVVIVIVCGLTWAAVAGDHLLPRIFLDDVRLNQGCLVVVWRFVRNVERRRTRAAMDLAAFGARSMAHGRVLRMVD